MAQAAIKIPEFEKFGIMITPGTDPTSTLVLRERFEAQMRKRWKQVIKVITESIVTNDVFGLRGLNNEVEALPAKSFAFMEPAEQVKAFMAWLAIQEQQTILEKRLEPWISPFLTMAMARGVIRGRQDLLKLARGPRLVTNQETPLQLLNSLGPLDLDSVDAQMALASVRNVRALQIEQTWQGLTGVTEQVNTQVAQILAQGLGAELSATELARQINDRVDKIGITRSEMIAQTSIVEANNRGALAEFTEAEQLIGEEVLVQWEATLDNRVRSTHLIRHGKVFKKTEYAQLIGEPRCRCAGLPYIQSVEGKADLSTASEFSSLDQSKAKKAADKIRRAEGLRVASPRVPVPPVTVVRKPKAVKTTTPKTEAVFSSPSLANKTPSARAVTRNVPMTREEAGAVEWYTGQGFAEVNSKLRSHRALTGIETTVKNIDSALLKAQKFEGATTRVVSFPGRKEELDSFITTHKAGSIVRYDEFLSTTQGSGVDALGLASFDKENVILKIKGKSGRDISAISSNKNEQEILFSRGSRFMVDSVERTKGATIIEMVEQI